jgi:hypothetical protein
MTEKVTLFIIDKDLRVRKQGKYELGDGHRIRIKSGGTENWNPKIGETTYIEKKSYKKWLFFGPRTWKREHYILNKGKQCIDFKSGNVPLPDPKELEEAVGATMLKDIGRSKLEIPWYFTVLLVVNIILSLLVANVLGVFR